MGGVWRSLFVSFGVSNSQLWARDRAGWFLFSAVESVLRVSPFLLVAVIAVGGYLVEVGPVY